ncbi:hypothetical protein BDA99DRAFT_537603 [Phascolomyces articulosus]|uniref:Carbohydrate esterase family 16 protein n=1 Tax=Phascolomyces articulosus TaxID=60185 RepID=A0AAD5JZS4_9FUNG|nr:hypothetical protein BDA99DRAFT_537603 [Phascolomyces articulosus]
MAMILGSSITTTTSALGVPNLVKIFTGEKQFCWDTTDMVFAFGDSYTNLMGPAGSVWTWNDFKSGKDSTLNGPIQPNGTTGHGPNWINYLTNCYEGLPQNCHPQLFDVAYGGATVSSALVKPPYDHIKDLDQQMGQWIDYIDPMVKWTPDTTLTMLWFGINDVGRSAKEITNDLELGIKFNKILDNYFQHLDKLHKEQQMRFFLINNVPPMDRTPSGLGDGAPRLRRLVKSFNDLLMGRIALYSTLNPDVTLVHFDAHKYFDYYLDHYKEFGFKDITNYCDKDKCELPKSQYFWMNGNHPMFPVHKLLGQDITRQLREKQQCSDAATA